MLVTIQITDPDTDPDTYRDTGKTCLGGGMHCPSTSSYSMFLQAGCPSCRPTNSVKALKGPQSTDPRAVKLMC